MEQCSKRRPAKLTKIQSNSQGSARERVAAGVQDRNVSFRGSLKRFSVSIASVE